MIVYNDETIINFGKYNGKKLIDIPDNYFIWYYNNNVLWYDGIKEKQSENKCAIFNYIDRCKFEFMQYIEESFDATELQ